MRSSYSTDIVPPTERLAYWQEFIRDSYVSLEVELNSQQQFFGSVDFESLGPIDISELRSSAQHVVRTEEAIAQSEVDYFFILAQLEGTGKIIQDNHTSELGVGDWALVDSTRPYQFCLEQDFRQLVVSIPRNSLPLLKKHSPYVTGQDLRQFLSLGDIVSNYLLSLSWQMHEIKPESRTLLAESVINLLCAALNETLPLHQELNDSSAVYLEQIKACIFRHLPDPELSVGTIANELNISNRYVHKLFRSMDMTVSEYIRKLRLENCRRDLVNETNKARNITDIAFYWGFNSAAHFSYLFKKHYGMSASEYRQQHSVKHDKPKEFQLPN